MMSTRTTLRNLLAMVDPQPAPTRVEGQYYKVTAYDGWTHVAQWDGTGFVYEWNAEGSRRGHTNPRDLASVVPLPLLPEPSNDLFLWIARLKFEAEESAMSDAARAELAKVSGLAGDGRIHWNQVDPAMHYSFIQEGEGWYRALVTAIISSNE